MSTVLDENLLYYLSKHNEDESREYTTPRKVFKYALVVFIVLTSCGLLAFGLSSLFFSFYDVPDILERHKYPMPLPNAATCGKRIVGYYTGWEPRKITENQISRMTHIIFVAIKMFGNGQIGFHNPEYGGRFFDMKRKARRVNGKIKVMIGVGGRSNSQFFSSVIADSQKKQSFISSLTAFLSTNEVDGLEIIWTVPFAELKDRKNLVNFLKDLREELTKLQHEKRLSDPYLVSMMTPQIIWKQSEGYDLEGIVKYADFLNVISYEFYGPWDIEEGAFTGPVGPLYGGRRGNIDDTMKIHTCETKKPSQLTLGIPLFGKFWKNVKREKINQTETMCVKEVCRIEGQEDISDIWRVSELKNGKPVGGLISWNDREDEEVGIPWNKTEAQWHDISKSAFIWKEEDQVLITFETERSIKEKIEYAVTKNMGGINLWSLNMDDDMDTVLNLISSVNMCTGRDKDEIMYKC
ncbi:unnamed protein product [Caenorhabditis brenneri]